MNIIDLYNDYSIPIASEGDRHYMEGWVNTPCPFYNPAPGHEGNHLGYNIEENYFFCWHCGWHSNVETISALLKISKKEAKKIIKEYEGKTKIKTPHIIIRKKAFKLPTNITELQQNHRKYLIKRNFDPDELRKIWNIQGTGPISKLDNISYKHRIFIPIFWHHKLVSFQARDITEKQKQKYMFCPKDRQILNPKHIIYRHPDSNSNVGICCEGVTDVWRIGKKYGFCTFGVSYKREQVRLISKSYNKIYILFDNDNAGIKQGKKLLADLRFAGVKTERIKIKNDPGSMSQEEANYFVKQLIK